MKIKFNDFILNEEEESSIKFPNSLDYWIEKGKRGKDCIIYTHDDLDGIYSAIAMKEYLLAHGFKISGYGIINYTESWKIFKLDKTYINICVDFAEDNVDLDLYIDHHMSEDFEKKSEHSVKLKSDSCYYLICYLLGMPTDKYILSVISMIDAAKYDEYGVDIKTILDLDWNEISKKPNARLIFAGAFNQFIKRSDFRTLIEVIHNGNLSIFNIFQLFKILYPINNIIVDRGVDKENIRLQLMAGDYAEFIDGLKEVPEFVPDSRARMQKMAIKTVGREAKEVITSYPQFKRLFWKAGLGKFKFDGFVVIRNLVYVPSGTWANPLRARALIAKTLKDDSNIQFIMMDYSSSLQIASYRKIENENNLPKLADGSIMDDLNVYTRNLVQEVLPREFNYRYDKAKGGGHPGIGNLTNIVGWCKYGEYDGIRIIDLMKNRIIHDLTGMDWDPKLAWNINDPVEGPAYELVLNAKLMMIPQIRKVKL